MRATTMPIMPTIVSAVAAALVVAAMAIAIALRLARQGQRHQNFDDGDRHLALLKQCAPDKSQ